VDTVEICGDGEEYFSVEEISDGDREQIQE
jgi:hypothetical protein